MNLRLLINFFFFPFPYLSFFFNFNINILLDITIVDVPPTAFKQNNFEKQILINYLDSKNISVNDCWKVCVANLFDHKYQLGKIIIINIIIITIIICIFIIYIYIYFFFNHNNNYYIHLY